MPSIDNELDAALVGCKRRAAEFNDRADWRPMSDCDENDVIWFIASLENNAYMAKREFSLHYGSDTYDEDAVLDDLRDAVNRGLLTLSILERRAGGTT